MRHGAPGKCAKSLWCARPSVFEPTPAVHSTPRKLFDLTRMMHSTSKQLCLTPVILFFHLGKLLSHRTVKTAFNRTHLALPVRHLWIAPIGIRNASQMSQNKRKHRSKHRKSEMQCHRFSTSLDPKLQLGRTMDRLLTRELSSAFMEPVQRSFQNVGRTFTRTLGVPVQSTCFGHACSSSCAVFA